MMIGVSASRLHDVGLVGHETNAAAPFVLVVGLGHHQGRVDDRHHLFLLEVLPLFVGTGAGAGDGNSGHSGPASATAVALHAAAELHLVVKGRQGFVEGLGLLHHIHLALPHPHLIFIGGDGACKLGSAVQSVLCIGEFEPQVRVHCTGLALEVVELRRLKEDDRRVSGGARCVLQGVVDARGKEVGQVGKISHRLW